MKKLYVLLLMLMPIACLAQGFKDADTLLLGTRGDTQIKRDGAGVVKLPQVLVDSLQIGGVPVLAYPGATPDGSNGIIASSFKPTGDPTYNVKAYGAKGDVRYVNDAAITAGQTSLTSATAAFTKDDNAKVFTVEMGAQYVYSGTYTSGITTTGLTGQTCLLSFSNGGGSGATAFVLLTGTNAVAGGAELVITAGGTGFTSAPTQATASAGSASACSGTVTVATTLKAAKVQTTLTYVNATTVTLGAAATTTVTNAYADIGTDDSAAVQAAIDAAQGADGLGHGGNIFGPNGRYLMLTCPTIRNNGATNKPHQPALRITGTSEAFNGLLNSAQGGAQLLYGTVFDLRCTATPAMISTYGIGVLEMDHIVLTTTSSSPFLYTTNTTLVLHNMAMVGIMPGKLAVNDGVTFGGTDTDSNYYGTNRTTAPFQGYSSVMQDVQCSQTKVCVRLQSAANNIKLSNVVSGLDCGSATAGDAPFMLTPPDVSSFASGNNFSDTLAEIKNYTYGYYLSTKATGNSFHGANCWDPAPPYTTSCFKVTSAGGNFIEAYTDSLATGKKVIAPYDNWFFDHTLGAMDSQMPMVKTSILIPRYFSPYSPTNGATVTLNAAVTGAATHNVIAGAGVSAITMGVPTITAGNTGQVIIVTIRNTSGGTLTTTWNAVFKLATWADPANGFHKTISFYYNGTNWEEMSRTADVAN